MVSESFNAIWRNWYLSAARELDGFDFLAFARANTGAFVSPDLIAALPAKAFFEVLTTRIKAEDTLDVTMTVGFRFPDVAEAFCLRLRRGVVEVEDNLAGNTDLTLTLDKAVLDRIVLGQLTMRDAILSGLVEVSEGPTAAVARFFGYFETPLTTPIQLVVR
jgi:alkyl sulfatase BDS1-like metallo-beta-lactamase superfamily hydrolase